MRAWRSAGEPRAARERLEEELRTALQARSVILRDEPAPLLAPNTLCFDVPFGYGDTRARLEVMFDGAAGAGRVELPGDRCRDAARGDVLELERATGRLMLGHRRGGRPTAPRR